jgi:Ca2+-binding EF-hand superfamily protein
MGGAASGIGKQVKDIYKGKRYPTRAFVENNDIPGQGEFAVNLFHELKLDKDHIDLFFSVFKTIDRDNSNEIDMEEFYRFFKMEPTPFADKVFALMDEDGSGDIDFSEFVLCIWNYCTLDLKSLIKFAFGLFDADGSGTLEPDEVEFMIREVYGDAWDSNIRVQRVVDIIDVNGDGVISFDEFQEFNRKYPCMLFPAFQMQQHLRKGIYGERWWNVLTQERLHKNFRSENIYELLDKMTKDAYQDKLAMLMMEIQAEAAVKQGL